MHIAGKYVPEGSSDREKEGYCLMTRGPLMSRDTRTHKRSLLWSCLYFQASPSPYEFLVNLVIPFYLLEELRSFPKWELWSFYLFFKKKILFIYLRDGEPAQAGGGADGEGEADSLLSVEPNVDGVQSQDPEIMTSAEVRHLTNWAIQVPQVSPLNLEIITDSQQVANASLQRSYFYVTIAE